MAAYEILLLNTSIPQIQAAQSGDTYLCPRELAVVVNSATDAVRITQTGAGNALLVEDSANPDATPFVVTAAGNVGIGTDSPGAKLDVAGNATVQNGVLTVGKDTVYDAFINSPESMYFNVDSDANSSGNKFTWGADRAGTTGGTTWMTLDSSGNLGLGVTPSGWGSNFRALQIADGVSLIGRVGISRQDLMSLSSNSYFNGTNYIYIGSRNAAMYSHDSGQHQWLTAPSGTAGNPITFTQAMTLDASGNLIVGDTATSSSAKTYVKATSGSSDFSNNATLFLNAGTETTTANLIRFNGAVAKGLVFGRAINADSFVWGFTNTTTPVMTLDASGNLLVGTTSAVGSLTGIQANGANRSIISYTTAGAAAGACLHARRDSDGNAVQFVYGGFESFVGSISVTSSATAYNTSSDYRLKNNPQPLTNSGAFIDALKPKTWDWKSGGKGVGFIAHEVAEVSPGTVVGEKDAVDADGKPIMQSMEYGSAEFIANIVAELQSLRARVAQLEGK